VLGRGKEDEHERQRQAVVETRLDVEQPAQTQRDVRTADQRGGEHRVCGRQDRTEQQRRRPVQARQIMRGDGNSHHCQRHPQPKCATGQAPVLAQCSNIRALTVGEQHGEQGDVGQRRDHAVIRSEVHQVETTRPDDGTGNQEQQCGAQHRPGRDAGQRHTDQQHDTECHHQGHAVLSTSLESAPCGIDCRPDFPAHLG
jgi:hypothetical protein